MQALTIRKNYQEDVGAPSDSLSGDHLLLRDVNKYTSMEDHNGLLIF